MPPSRQAMIAALKSTVVPYLRERGYRGSFPHLRRTSASGVDLITFQFDRNGGAVSYTHLTLPTNREV